MLLRIDSSLLPLIGLLAGMALLSGCTRSEPSQSSASGTGQTTETQSESANGTAADPSGSPLASFDSRSEQVPVGVALPNQTPEESQLQREGQLQLDNLQRKLAITLDQLRERPPAELTRFLAMADEFMQQSILQDQPSAQRTEIVRMKLEAARLLKHHTDADESQRSDGARGELQALSHLAMLQDVTAAKELEAIARNNLESADAMLAMDSRLVLIGFAIESLQNGDEGAAQELVTLIQAVSKRNESPYLPALMAMGQAKFLLKQFGHEEAATQVRDHILKLYADASDPEVAKIVAEVAGNVQYDGIETIREDILAGKSVTVEQWQSAVETLIAESADMQTVQYLAAAALELEGFDCPEFATATYELLQDQFRDPESAMGQEVQIAIAAKQARQQAIGREFDLDLPTVDGRKLPLSDLQGKVVLMPFWMIQFQESLYSLPRLLELQKKHGDKVLIVGMNLDPPGAPVEEFLKDSPVDFPSYLGGVSSVVPVEQRLEAQFGMMSMPFLVILDQQSRVAAIDFCGYQLEETVAQLLATETSE